MFDCTAVQREKQYQNLSSFTKNIHREIMEVVSSLGWTVESVENDDDNRLLCPYDSAHRIGKRILGQHLESCRWKQEGYDQFDVPLPDSGSSSSSYTSLKLDSAAQNSILLQAKRNHSDMKIGLGERLIPQTSDRIFADFTCDERRVLYDYVVSNTMKTNIGDDITDIQKLKMQDKEHKKLSFLELLVQERNLKRRRAKHRGVHTNKKSHTEILREVIHQQMELYIDYLTEARKTNEDTRTTATRENQSFHHEPPSKRRSLFAEDSSELYVSYDSRNDHKYKTCDDSYSSNAKNSGHRDKYSRLTVELRETQKSYKSKRSRSRDSEHDDKKGKHGCTRTHYRREEYKVKRKREITE